MQRAFPILLDFHSLLEDDMSVALAISRRAHANDSNHVSRDLTGRFAERKVGRRPCKPPQLSLLQSLTILENPDTNVTYNFFMRL